MRRRSGGVCERAAAGEVDAVVSSDLGAAFCVHEALRLGIRVPDELQIVAYDGTYLTSAAGMTITAIRQDCRAMAELVATRMSDAIRSEAGGVHGAGQGADTGEAGSGFVADRAGDDADDVGCPGDLTGDGSVRRRGAGDGGARCHDAVLTGVRTAVVFRHVVLHVDGAR